MNIPLGTFNFYCRSPCKLIYELESINSLNSAINLGFKFVKV